MPKCEECGGIFPNWIEIDGKKRSLSKRKYCLSCSPYGSRTGPRKGKRRSKVWKVSSENFRQIISTSHSVSEVLRTFGLSPASGSGKTLKRRMLEEGLEAEIERLRKESRHRKRGIKKVPTEKILVKGSTFPRGHMKRRVLKEGLLENKCHICGQQPAWCGLPLVLIIDHINGIRDDHRLENLRMLCPNCNSQTKTFAGRNAKRSTDLSATKGSGRRTHKHVCRVCKKLFESPSTKARHCSVECSSVGMRRCERPDKDELERLVWEKPTSTLAREFGVSDVAIAKWCKQLGIEKPPRGYWRRNGH